MRMMFKHPGTAVIGGKNKVYNIDQIVNLFNKFGMPLQLELSGYLLIYNKKMKSMLFMKVGV